MTCFKNSFTLKLSHVMWTLLSLIVIFHSIRYLPYITHQFLKFDVSESTHENKRNAEAWATKDSAKLFNSTILMGQFNYKSNHLKEWSDCWLKTESFDKIVIAVPNSTSLIRNERIDLISYREDKGYVSPYTNIGKVIRKNQNVKSLLYVHDDLLISKLIHDKVGKTEWIISDEHQMGGVRRLDADQVIRLYENGEFYLNSTRMNNTGQMTRLYENGTFYLIENKPLNISFFHWKHCRTSFKTMYTDPRLDPYRQQFSLNGKVLSALDFRFGQSDMLHLSIQSTEERNAILELIDLFGEHDLFLDCAISTLVLMMQQRFKIKTYYAPLCTSWDYSKVRNNPQLLISKCKRRRDVNFELFHPVKISKISSWPTYFHNLMSR